LRSSCARTDRSTWSWPTCSCRAAARARALVEGLIELGLNLPVLYLSDYEAPPPNLPGNPVRFLSKPFDLAQLDLEVAGLLGH